MSASIFSLSCDLDWNAVRKRVIPSPQLWGPSVARGASVFCHVSSQSTAEMENGANRAFQSPIYLPPHLSTEKFYRNYAYGHAAVPSTLGAVPASLCEKGCSGRGSSKTEGRAEAELSTETRQLSSRNPITQSSPNPAPNCSRNG